MIVVSNNGTSAIFIQRHLTCTRNSSAFVVLKITDLINENNDNAKFVNLAIVTETEYMLHYELTVGILDDLVNGIINLLPAAQYRAEFYNATEYTTSLNEANKFYQDLLLVRE